MAHSHEELLLSPARQRLNFNRPRRRIGRKEPDPRAVSRGSMIRKLREDEGLTQKQVAEALGVSAEWVSLTEAGAFKHIEPVKRLMLCDILGLDEDELIIERPPNARQVVELARRGPFGRPVSHEAKAFAYKWDRMPSHLKEHIKTVMRSTEVLSKQAPGVLYEATSETEHSS